MLATGALLGSALLPVPVAAHATAAPPDPARTAAAAVPAAAPAAAAGLDDPAKKEIAMKIVSSAENSSLDWKAQYKYI
ncbi:chitosanase, partial [Streptomyces virginiae]